MLGLKPVALVAGEGCAGSSGAFREPSRAGSLYPSECQQTPRTALWGPLICLSFPRHKWPILRAIELCLKNVKCIWKRRIFADAWSPALSSFHDQPLGSSSVGASQMIPHFPAGSGNNPKSSQPPWSSQWPSGQTVTYGSGFILLIVFFATCEGSL